MKCKTIWMHYRVDKLKERQSQRASTLHVCRQPRTGPSLSLRTSTTQSPREAGQHDKEMQPWYLVCLLGGEKRCYCWLQMKACFSRTVLSGGFIVLTHHYSLATCPGIYCVCFGKLRFSTFPAFLTVKTIWSPMRQLDLQCYSAVASIPLGSSWNTEGMSYHNSMKGNVSI